LLDRDELGLGGQMHEDDFAGNGWDRVRALSGGAAAFVDQPAQDLEPSHR
jgi:hypothetical protein